MTSVDRDGNAFSDEHAFAHIKRFAYGIVSRDSGKSASRPDTGSPFSSANSRRALETKSNWAVVSERYAGRCLLSLLVVQVSKQWGNLLFLRHDGTATSG